MSSDEDDSLGLFTAVSKLLQDYNYDVGNVNTASSSDSDDKSFSSGHMDVSTDHRVHSTDSWKVMLCFPWTLMSINAL